MNEKSEELPDEQDACVDEDVKELLERISEQTEQKAVIADDNIFAILEKERDERTHCRILRYLIEKFWRSFKTNILREQLGLEENKLGDKPECVCEYPIEKFMDCEWDKDGSIDILITAKDYIIPIEVKVGASDQPRQLLRYYNYFCRKHKDKEVHVVYLTPNGKEASSYSLECPALNKCDKKSEYCGQVKSKYRRLSYEDIIKWLNTVMGENSYNDGAIIAKWYKEILQKERETMANAEIIIDSAKAFKAANAVYEAYTVARDAIKKEFFNELKKELDKQCENEAISIQEKDSCKGMDKIKYYKDAELIATNGGNPIFSVCADKCSLYMCIFEEGKFEDWKYITEDWFKEEVDEYTKSNKNELLVDVNTFEPNGNHDNIIVEWKFNRKQATSNEDAYITCLAKNIIKAYNTGFDKKNSSNRA